MAKQLLLALVNPPPLMEMEVAKQLLLALVNPPPLVETEEVKPPLVVETGVAKQLLLVPVEIVLTRTLTYVQVGLSMEKICRAVNGWLGWQKTAKYPAIFVVGVLVSWNGHIQAFCIIPTSHHTRKSVHYYLFVIRKLL